MQGGNGSLAPELLARPEGLGTLMMIGGAEDKTGRRTCLQALAELVGEGSLVLATLASEEPELQWRTYSRVFHELGIPSVQRLVVRTRDDLSRVEAVNMLKNAKAVFFTGGDQLRITTLLGGTPAYDIIRALYKKKGGIIAGTSAGAAAMGQVMLMSTASEGPETHKIRQAFIMARGLALIRDVVIDQHFAQRARIERLLGAIAENPGVLGLGIDEDTAIIVDWQHFKVIGSGAVYVADGSGISYSNIAERGPESTLCLHHVKLHVLATGSAFDMAGRQPYRYVQVGASIADETGSPASAGEMV
ncbi:MAG TPA: cyanophycinase [Bryobacteraceae bacterium]|nr:cyanophycinase [Bryobacteraceae bacterium]